MGAVRTFLTSRLSGSRRLVADSLSVLLIVGLLAMHVLSLSGSMGGEHPADTSPVTSRHDVVAAVTGEAMATVTGEVGAGSDAEVMPVDVEVPCDCCAAFPEHSMASMSCVLALPSGIPLPVAVTLVDRPWSTAGEVVRSVLPADGILPAPRPPSLTSLSISRT